MSSNWPFYSRPNVCWSNAFWEFSCRQNCLTAKCFSMKSRGTIWGVKFLRTKGRGVGVERHGHFIDTDWAGNPYWRGGLSTVDLLVLTSLDQLLFLLKILFTLFTKQATLMRRSTVPSLPFQLGFPGLSKVIQPSKSIKTWHWQINPAVFTLSLSYVLLIFIYSDNNIYI
jgi:hypothetical protein